MPGPALLVLMATPLVGAWVLATQCRPSFARAAPLSGLWLIPLIAAAAFSAARLQHAIEVDDQWVNRGLAGTILMACLVFTAANRGQPSRLVRWGSGLAVGGAASNAAAMLVYGYMPVLAASVESASGQIGVGDHPDASYVAVDAGHLLALVLGDVLPVPPLHSVVSLGDLALAPGSAILLASFLTPLVPARRPASGAPLGAHEGR